MLSPRLNVVPWPPPLLPPAGSYFPHLPLLSTLCTADFTPSLLLRLLPLPLPTFTIPFSSSIHRSHPGRVFDAVSSVPRTVLSFLKVQLSVDFSSVDVLVVVEIRQREHHATLFRATLLRRAFLTECDMRPRGNHGLSSREITKLRWLVLPPRGWLTMNHRWQRSLYFYYSKKLVRGIRAWISTGTRELCCMRDAVG